MFSSLPIRRKLLLPGLFALLVFVAILSLFWANKYADQLQRNFVGQMSQTETFITPPLAEGVWNFNEPMIESALSGLDSFDAFVFAQIQSEGQLVASRHRSEEWDPAWDGWIEPLFEEEGPREVTIGDILIQRVPLIKDEQQIGFLVWAFSNAKLDEQLASANTVAAGIGLTAFVSFAVLLLFIANSVANPMSSLIGKIELLQAGETDLDIKEARRKDEIGKLGKALESFRDNLVETTRLEEEQRDAEAARVKAEADKAARERELAEAEKEAEKERQQAEADRLRQEALLKEKQLEEQSRIDAEKQAVVEALGAALESLSAGSMTCSIQTPFPAEYETLRDNFNSAVSKLAQTVHTTVEKSEVIQDDAQSLSAAAEGLAKRTEHQASALQQTTSAVSELARGSKDCANLANEARTLAETAKDTVNHGSDVVKQTVEAMAEIEKGSGEISRILGVLEDISFQTNLLALNAGVEAARAGEAGSGFAVVAAEVRALAARSSEAAREIGTIIVANSSSVSQGADLVSQCGNSLTAINTSISEIFDKNASIDLMSNDQSNAINEMKNALNDLDTATQQNTAMFEETSAAITALDTEARALLDMMSVFELPTHPVISQERESVQRTETA